KLPFDLTGAQVRALEEIFADMRRAIPMGRLLQGDVGSGKTAVAAAAAIQAIANGFQAAIMAPTEILAEQHYKGLRALLGKVRVPRGAGARGRGPEDGEPTSGPRPPAPGPQDWKADADPDQIARLDEIKRLLGMMPEDDLDGQG